MKKTFITISVIILFILGLVFKYNILGFYHELIKNDVLDLGGYGVEKISGMEYDQDGNLYVLSISHKDVRNNEGYIDNSQMILLTKISDNKNVVWSLPIKTIVGKDISKNGTVEVSELTLSKDHELLFLMTHRVENTQSEYIVRVYDDGKEFDAVNVSKENREASKLVYNEELLYVFYDNYYDNEYSVSLLYKTFDTKLKQVEQEEISVSEFNVIDEILIHDNAFYFLTSSRNANVITLKLQKLSLEDKQHALLLTDETSMDRYFTSVNETRIVYTTIDDLWDVVVMKLNGYDFEQDEFLTLQDINLQNTDNRIWGITLDEQNSIFVYGAIGAPTYVNSFYEKYDENSKHQYTYSSKIGGIDSIRNLQPNQDGTLALVIASKRIKDMDYIGPSNSYDQIIRFRNDK